ncbi:MAG: hypothetical protein KAS67_06025 [Thermoplasmata archaeon]|nr:hypothetical protein [Thermoplasmata archaeon]
MFDEKSDKEEFSEREYLYLEILRSLYNWGDKGVTREVFYKEIPALRYEDLHDIIDEMEAEAYIFVEWTDLARFRAYLTEDGTTLAKSRIDDLQKKEKADPGTFIQTENIERI